MSAMYKHKGQVVPMAEADVAQIIDAAEIEMRTSAFSYSSADFAKFQVDEIKAHWPEDMRNLFRAKVKELAGTNAITGTTCRQALWACCKAIAERRKSQNAIELEMLNTAAETAVATLFGKVAPIDAQSSRRYTEGGKLIRARCSVNPRRLVVNVDEVAQADLYVLGLYDTGRTRAFLVGFATQEDVKAAKSGNKITDPTNCQWSKTAHYLPLEKLRPMSEFHKMHAKTQVPEGVAFEKVPNLDVLPTLASQVFQDMLKPGVPEYDLMEYLTKRKA